jgi:hypothetical protein
MHPEQPQYDEGKATAPESRAQDPKCFHLLSRSFWIVALLLWKGLIDEVEILRPSDSDTKADSNHQEIPNEFTEVLSAH